MGLEMLLAAPEGLCCHKWPLGTPSQGGRRLQGTFRCPPAAALGSLHTQPLVTGVVWGALSPSIPVPSRPGVMSLSLSPPVLSSPALEPNRNEVSSRAALIPYEPQIKRNNFLKNSIYFTQTNPPMPLILPLLPRLFPAPPAWSLLAPGTAGQSCCWLCWQVLHAQFHLRDPLCRVWIGKLPATVIYQNHLFALAHREPIRTLLLVFRLFAHK